MNILFISYWGMEDGLTKSTVIPNLQILSDFEDISRIILVTIERGELPKQPFIRPKITHYPVISGFLPVPLLDKMIDFYRIPRILTRLIRQINIEKVIARGSPAGAMAYLSWKRNGIPFYVESFEPHADYMLETSVWKIWDPRYFFQKRWEKKQIKYAKGLMPVTINYTRELTSQGYPSEKMAIAPCAVDFGSFKFNETDRKRIRIKLGITNQVTGIYVGKFGGLYMDQEIIQILRTIISYFNNFYLIILTPAPVPHIEKRLSILTGEKFNYSIHHVNHEDVAPYLSAADFGMALNKIFKSSQYLSPIKIGEYWANGLPVLLTKGVGDEYRFIEKEVGGAIFDIYNLTSALRKIEQIIEMENHRSHIPTLAKKYRSFDQVTNAYRKLLINR